MKTNHTPEPWTYKEDCDSRGNYVGFGPRNNFVGETHISVNNLGTVQALANAHRIVACVNACKGIPTEDLEDQAEVTKALKEGIESASPIEDVKKRLFPDEDK